jgi:hypothetical protein
MPTREDISTTTFEAEIVETAAVEGAEAEGLVEMVLSEHREQQAVREGRGKAAKRIEGIVIGTLQGIGAAGEPLVDFPVNPRGGPVPARSTVRVDAGAVGREAALMFEGGDPAKPILIGLIHCAELESEAPSERAEEEEAGGSSPETFEALEVEADGEKVVLEAKRELVLRCGKASITLTRAGKILVRGTYVLTRSSGVNRIQGGSVQIN